MKFGAKIKGLDKLNKKIIGFKKEVLSGQVLAVQNATLLVHSTAVELLQDNADGRSQKRYNPRRIVNVSNPGDPPNTDTGRAVQSIKMDFKDGGLIGRVGTNLKYLKGLEFGTRHVAARPWLSTAIKIASKDIAKIFKEAMQKAIVEVSK